MFTTEQIYDACIERVEVMALSTEEWNEIVSQLMHFRSFDRNKLILALNVLEESEDSDQYRSKIFKSLKTIPNFESKPLEELIQIQEDEGIDLTEIEEILQDETPKSPSKENKKDSKNPAQKSTKKAHILEIYEEGMSVKELQEITGYTAACIRHALKAVKK